MKKLISLLLVILFLAVSNVKADAGGPMVIGYDVIVSNKNGAACYKYNNGKYDKTNKVLSYDTVINIYEELSSNDYVSIWQESCDYVKKADLKTKKDTFGINEEGVEKLTEVKAVVLAKGGLNLRKGPAVAYSRITTIPQYSVITLKYRAGTYWFYTEFNGKSGWVSAINNYLGLDSNEILFTYKETEIRDVKDGNKVLGKIPAYTEITDYVNLISDGWETHYVNYNGIKGEISYVPYKVNGKIKLLDNAKVYNGKNVIGEVKKGEVLDFTLQEYDEDFIFYIPSKGGVLHLRNNEVVKDYEIIQTAKDVKKTKGFIGEGLFGEKKTSNTNNEPSDKPTEPSNNQNSNSNNTQEVNNNDNKNVMSKELIIICVLGSIVLALVIVIVILLINKRKQMENSKVTSSRQYESNEKKENEENKELKEQKEASDENEKMEDNKNE